MIELKLIGLVTAIGAAVWLVRVVFFRTQRRKLDLAMQALKDTGSPHEDTSSV